MMGFGLIIPILVIALFAYLLGWRPGNLNFPANGQSQQKPLDVLKERYARGEIDRDTYEQMRRDLE